MSKYPIINYEYEPIYDYEKITDTYEVKSKNKKVRRCINLMVKRKLIEPYKQKVRVNRIKPFIVDTHSIINDLCEKISMYRYAYNQEIAGIMVGRKHFELIHSDYITKSSMAYGELHYMGNGTHSIIGIPIVLNPFIDGVVFCTKDMINNMLK